MQRNRLNCRLSFIYSGSTSLRTCYDESVSETEGITASPVVGATDAVLDGLGQVTDELGSEIGRGLDQAAAEPVPLDVVVAFGLFGRGPLGYGL